MPDHVRHDESGTAWLQPNINRSSWGLWRVGKASEERNRQLEQQGEALGKVGQALDRQGEVLAELLRRTA